MKTTTATATNSDRHRPHRFLLPPQLEQRVAALASRDANGIASTVRRLISVALEEEEQRRGDR